MRTQKTRKRSPAQTKRLMLILAAAALLLIVVTVGFLWYLFKEIGGIGSTRPEQDFTKYLSEKWTVFTLRSWDAETGDLELDYPLRFSYAQMEKYGASLEELRELPTGNFDTVTALKSASFEDCGVKLRNVTVYGITTDGETAYTVLPDGKIRACWESP